MIRRAAHRAVCGVLLSGGLACTSTSWAEQALPGGGGPHPLDHHHTWLLQAEPRVLLELIPVHQDWHLILLEGEAECPGLPEFIRVGGPLNTAHCAGVTLRAVPTTTAGSQVQAERVLKTGGSP